ncbi:MULTISPECIES: peptidylprolyl isomerase [Basfia]|uniref:Peptidyl-prolyl cis-trans isomerase n=2 Tax=Basfia TaxID=697331 RepID=Q65QF4_MANSM|nr:MULTISPECIES: peptidylprolyl isomerase [Basfia]AAU38806.1 SlpA protein [[Mannheimia] succiniciproducens MBEL55E]QIM69332.1 peptidylprolyl isomerase [Basfia succiniciproducens]SCY09991.1 FKBP-type peptidyl-prolyl cis-trans isomerase SlyD [Basfia succiniciproducens]
MKVAKNIVVGIAYQVRTEDGVLVDEAPTNQPLEYLQGHNNLVIGLENALEGKAVGDKFEVRVKPEEGYGEYNENMVQRVPKDVFVGVDELAVGMRFIADTDMGPLPVVITEVSENDVVVDGNHMLAGQELLFTVEVVSAREATPEEIAHGHIHSGDHDHGHGGCGCGGHGHEHDHDHSHGGCGCGGHGHHHDHGHDHHHGEGCCGGHGKKEGHGHGNCGCGGHGH